MDFTMIEQGFVLRQQPNAALPVTAGPRVAITQAGHTVLNVH
ncbi:MAG: hypothetical protein ABGX16_00765 [Pirellulales bacterium]